MGGCGTKIFITHPRAEGKSVAEKGIFPLLCGGRSSGMAKPTWEPSSISHAISAFLLLGKQQCLLPRVSPTHHLSELIYPIKQAKALFPMLYGGPVTSLLLWVVSACCRVRQILGWFKEEQEKGWRRDRGELDQLSCLEKLYPWVSVQPSPSQNCELSFGLCFCWFWCLASYPMGTAEKLLYSASCSASKLITTALPIGERFSLSPLPGALVMFYGQCPEGVGPTGEE